jgi:hypothetical protein
MQAFYRRFGPGAQRHNNYRNAAQGTENELASHFFRDNTHYTQSKCRMCAQRNMPMPRGHEIPVGLDQDDLLACGHLYEHAMLEERMFEKNMLRPRRVAANVCQSFALNKSTY